MSLKNIFKWVWDSETEYYDEEITRDTDWGGDESTGNVPVSGGRVQEWLKNEINGKFGVVRLSELDPATNYYTLELFATKEDEQLYDENPEGYKDRITRITIPISAVQTAAYTALLNSDISTSADIVVTDNKLEVPLNYRSIIKDQFGLTNPNYFGTLIIQTSTNGETWNTVGTIPNILTSQEPDDTSYIDKNKVDIGKYLTNGKQYLRLRRNILMKTRMARKRLLIQAML